MHVKCYLCGRMVHESKTEKRVGYHDREEDICNEESADECVAFMLDNLSRMLF